MTPPVDDPVAPGGGDADGAPEAILSGGVAGSAGDPDPTLVRDAIADGDPLPGGSGFAGRLDDVPGYDGPVLVRDVLGREPLFVGGDAPEPTADGGWAFDRRDLATPVPLGAGRLASAAEAGAHRETVWTLPNPAAAEPDAALAAVEDAVTAAIGDVDPAGAAVAFSGGVDSALVATGAPAAPCYVAGFEGCHDVAAARDAADAMDRDLRVVEITHADVERAVPRLVRATGRTNAMDLSIALPLYLTAQAVASDGYDRLLIGQGADELFGGYSKVVEPADDRRVAAETVRGARRETVGTLPEQLERDVLAVRAATVEPVAPLLADRVVDAALRLPASLIATPEERKIALRNAARGLVPESVRTADKKAVQYGTYVSRELDRLARRAGFKRRMDDHVAKYVRALVAGDE